MNLFHLVDIFKAKLLRKAEHYGYESKSVFSGGAKNSRLQNKNIKREVRHMLGGYNKHKDIKGPKTGVTPRLIISDGRGVEAIEFYENGLGATTLYAHQDEKKGTIFHAHMLINGASVMLRDDYPDFFSGHNAGLPSGVVLHLQLTVVDYWWERALECGAKVLIPLENQFWGDRYGQLIDPFGHIWALSKSLGEITPNIH